MGGDATMHEELLRRMPVGVVIAERSGDELVVQWCNAAACQTLGRSLDEGSSLSELVLASDALEVSNLFEGAKAGVQVELRTQNGGGNAVGTLVALTGERIAVVVRDDPTTELRVANRFLDSIIENIPSMIFVKDAEDLRFIRFNRAGETLLGLCLLYTSDAADE